MKSVILSDPELYVLCTQKQQPHMSQFHNQNSYSCQVPYFSLGVKHIKLFISEMWCQQCNGFIYKPTVCYISWSFHINKIQ